MDSHPSVLRVGIRPARPADVDAVLALWARARTAAASTPDTPEALANLLDHTPDALLVAQLEEDGPIAGALIAAWDGWRGNMYRLAVDAPHRRRRLAMALVAEGERWLKAKGATRITALVGRGDDPAAGLWQAAGYARDETIDRFVRNV
jgi:ribosomal protein S18 acetylase RimI-like enzyme